MEEQIYKLKIAALLHDPPDKPFEIERHTERAKNLAEDILGSEISNLIDNDQIKLADKIASSFDRWILSILMGGEWIPGLFKYEEKKIKNIVEPILEKELKFNLAKDDYNKYIKDLKETINGTSDWKLRYHLLYLLYEPLWILRGLPWGPADTRVPTHSVFDHNYATAAMINWVLSSKEHIKGLLVGLDVAGVQEFISSSRKIRDMWISSYIVSALTWYTVVELIKNLGPDIVIMPSMRMNPFYLYWFENMLSDRISNNIAIQIKLLGRLFYLSNIVYDMFEKLELPPYPVLPGRSTLVLPPMEVLRKVVLGVDNECVLEKYLIERFKKGWNLLWKPIKNLAEMRAKEDKKENIIWNFINNVFRYYEKLNIKSEEVPPLRLRVEIVEINERTDRVDLWRIYDEKYRELVNKISLLKYSREEPEIELNLYEVTEKAFNGMPIGFPKPSDKGFDYCTSCGKLPAIVILPADTDKEEEPEKDEYGLFIYCTVIFGEDPTKCAERLKKRNNSDEFKEFIEKYKGWLNEDNNRRALRTLKILYAPAEKLCPWCFLKRVLSLEPRILKILLIDARDGDVDKIVKDLAQDSTKATIWFPSLSHIASTRLYERISLLDLNNLRALIERSIHKRLIRELRLPQGVTWVWHFAKKTYKEIEKKIDGSNLDIEEKKYLKYLTQNIIINDPEYLWFNPDVRLEWNQILKDFNNLFKWYWNYYTLIRADGDFVGDLLEGKFTALIPGMISRYIYENLLLDEHVDEREVEVLKKYLSRYIKSSCVGLLKQFIGEVLEGKELESVKRKWAKRITEEVKSARITEEMAYKRVEEAVKILQEIFDRELRLIVSPSYHTSISASLMRAALLDIAIISELDGVVVYTGGDDLLAIAPIDKALDIVRSTRRAYGGYPVDEDIGFTVKIDEKDIEVKVKLDEGFLLIGHSYMPMLPGVGRSYAIYIAHYHYPLSVVISRSLKLLDEAKEGFKLRYFDEHEQRFLESIKDVAVIAYNPRAIKEEYAILPLTWHRPIITLSMNQYMVEKSSKSIAGSLSMVKELLKLIDERMGARHGKGEQPKISHSLLYEAAERSFVEALRQLIAIVRKEPSREREISEFLEKLLERLIEKNVNVKHRSGDADIHVNILKRLRELLPSFMVYYISVAGSEREERDNEKVEMPLLSNIIYAANLIRSAMR